MGFGNKLPLDCTKLWTLKLTKSFVFASIAWQQGVFTVAELLLLLFFRLGTFSLKRGSLLYLGMLGEGRGG